MHALKTAQIAECATWDLIVQASASQPTPAEAIRAAYGARLEKCSRLHKIDHSRELLVSAVLRAWVDLHIPADESESFTNGFYCFMDFDGTYLDPPAWAIREAWLRGRDSNPAFGRRQAKSMTDFSWVSRAVK